MVDNEHADRVSARYTFDDLEEHILNGLRVAGIDSEHVTIETLAPADQLHSGGLRATLEMIILSEGAGDRALDVGGGLGGPARALASRTGRHVTVLDLTPAFLKAGAALTARMGLSDRVIFQQGDALAMPFADGSFDLVWTQHASMNITDKKRLYDEIYRVLRPGGRFILHDHMAGPVQPLHFPVPWASEPSISHLIAPEEARDLLRAAGFRELVWEDRSEATANGFKAEMERARAAGAVAPVAGLRLAQGDGFDEMMRTQERNFDEGRVATVMALLERP